MDSVSLGQSGAENRPGSPSNRELRGEPVNRMGYLIANSFVERADCISLKNLYANSLVAQPLSEGDASKIEAAKDSPSSGVTADHSIVRM